MEVDLNEPEDPVAQDKRQTPSAEPARSAYDEVKLSSSASAKTFAIQQSQNQRSDRVPDKEGANNDGKLPEKDGRAAEENFFWANQAKSGNSVRGNTNAKERSGDRLVRHAKANNGEIAGLYLS